MKPKAICIPVLRHPITAFSRFGESESWPDLPDRCVFDVVVVDQRPESLVVDPPKERT